VDRSVPGPRHALRDVLDPTLSDFSKSHGPCVPRANFGEKIGINSRIRRC
jgi:hypothetical protein